LDLSGTDPNFGYVPGEIYTIRLDTSPASTSAGGPCSVYGLPAGVTGNFGFADPLNIGGSTQDFIYTLLNGGGRHCIPIAPASLPPDTGVSATPSYRAIQDRFDQDTNPDSYLTYTAYTNNYLTDARSNNRRVIRVAFNDHLIPHGTSDNYNVLGFGCFFIPVRPTIHPPSSPICMMYVGQCDQTGQPTGGTTPSLTKIVLFR
jgi:hypothetical protein